MNAKEAREIVETKIAEDISSEISRIKDLIARAVNNKKLEIEYSGYLNNKTQQHFRSEGYNVKYHQVGYNEYAYLISWK